MCGVLSDSVSPSGAHAEGVLTQVGQGRLPASEALLRFSLGLKCGTHQREETSVVLIPIAAGMELWVVMYSLR